MELLKNQNIVLIILTIFYLLPMFLGYFLKKNYDIKINTLNNISQGLSDPITKKIHKFFLKKKNEFTEKKKKIIPFLIDLIDKFILVALITRVIYAFVFIIPIFLTIWSGFASGVLFSTSKNRISFSVILEEIAYIFASVVGLSFGSRVFEYLLMGNKFKWDLDLNFLLYSLLFISISSLVEIEY